jgi:bifunctional UDP-N-acetylglucosamine pyrophosphorylase/glucosamine-1-phosphate N-acetyltransferase
MMRAMGATGWSVVVLAAGQGTRMKSTLPKVLHEVCGRSLLDRVLDRALELAPAERTVVVVGHGADRVREAVRPRGVRTVVQQPQLGTGDALRVGLTAKSVANDDGVIVLSGDVPLLRSESIRAVCDAVDDGATAALLTANLDDAGPYGRVVRAADGGVDRIVEARDATGDELMVSEVNAGVYAFRRDALARALGELTTDNAQREYYLTDLVSGLRAHGLSVEAVVLSDPLEMQGVNTRADLARVAALVNRRTLDRLMADGVTVVDPSSVWVDDDCRVGRDTVLEPGVVLRRGTRIGEGARVGAHAVLEGVEVARGETVPPLVHRASSTGPRG